MPRRRRPVPASLLAEHVALGRSAAFAGQDPFVPLAQLRHGHDGFIVIKWEQQRCARWAIRSDDDSADPTIFIDSGDGHWRKDAGPVSSFVVWSILGEAIFSERHCTNTEVVSDRMLSALVEAFEPLAIEPFVCWFSEDSGLRLFGGSNTLVLDHAETWLWAACLTRPAVQHLQAAVPGPWRDSAP